MDSLKYIHNEVIHRLKDPEIIVPIIIKVLNPKSVVDLGCGIGTFLHVFKKQGVEKILGLDGEWTNKDLLSKYISLSEFKVVDIERGFEINNKFDLAVCLEVFEHIDDKYANIAVKNLTQLSDTILFSSAIPGQMGQNHVNGQWPEYWSQKFSQFGFAFYDVLRPVFWNQKDLAWWYKQNMFLVVRNGCESKLTGFKRFMDSLIKPLVHPDCYMLEKREAAELTLTYMNVLSRYNSIMKGKTSFRTFSKITAKFILGKLHHYK